MRIPVRLAIAICFGSTLLSACTQHIFLLSPDYGVAVSQDLAAQVADPDARYSGVPAPGSSGARAALAQFRYGRDQVIQPATTTTLSISAGGGGGGGGAGAAPGAAVGAGP